MGGQPARHSYFRGSPRDSLLNELARSKPSDVMSLYSTSAKNLGSTHVAFGFPDGFGLALTSGWHPVELLTLSGWRQCETTHLANKESPGTGPGPSLGRKRELQTERGNFR